MKGILVFVIFQTFIEESFEIKPRDVRNPTVGPRDGVSDWLIRNQNPLNVNRTVIKDAIDNLKGKN